MAGWCHDLDTQHYMKVHCLCVCVCARSIAQPRMPLCDSTDCSPTGSSYTWSSPGKNVGVGSHSFLQGIFPTQGSNPGLLHCRQILYHLSHQGNPGRRVEDGQNQPPGQEAKSDAAIGRR